MNFEIYCYCYNNNLYDVIILLALETIGISNIIRFFAILLYEQSLISILGSEAVLIIFNV